MTYDKKKLENEQFLLVLPMLFAFFGLENPFGDPTGARASHSA